jgi:hypothetical protein
MNIVTWLTDPIGWSICNERSWLTYYCLTMRRQLLMTGKTVWLWPGREALCVAVAISSWRGCSIVIIIWNLVLICYQWLASLLKNLKRALLYYQCSPVANEISSLRNVYSMMMTSVVFDRKNQWKSRRLKADQYRYCPLFVAKSAIGKRTIPLLCETDGDDQWPYCVWNQYCVANGREQRKSMWYYCGLQCETMKQYNEKRSSHVINNDMAPVCV